VVICFLYSKNISHAEINHELFVVYGQNVMREAVVRQWLRMFKDWRTNIHDEERSGWPSAMRNNLVQSVN
jgi:hypothetical protein